MTTDRPLLPPDSFPSPEGDYTLNTTLFHASILAPPPSISPTSPPPGVSMNLAASMAGGMGIPGGFAPSALSMSPTYIAASAASQPNPTPPWPVRVSWVMMNLPPPKSGGGAGFGGLLGLGGKDQAQQPIQQSQNTGYEASSSSSEDSSDPSTNDPLPTPHNGTGKRPLAPRPKNSLRSTNSTFITRVSSLDTLTKLILTPTGLYPPTSLDPPTPSPPNLARWCFLNHHRSLLFVSLDPFAIIPSNTGAAHGLRKDTVLMRLNFANNVTAHTVCEQTKSSGGGGGGGGGGMSLGMGLGKGEKGEEGPRLDVLVGFATGDILFMDPLLGKYTRLNKSGIIHSSPITSLKYHPTSPHLFYALHADGLLFQYSTLLEDPSLPPTAPVAGPWSTPLKAWRGATGGEQAEGEGEKMFVWKNEEGLEEQKGKTAMGWGGRNPVGLWKVGAKGIKHFEFSPDGRTIAAVSDDGMLRIIDVASETLLDIYAGYFGGLTCVSWSPDGRFIITGGQDDLITIFSPLEARVVARCQGHSSFVTSLAFDRRRSGARGYRFGSVGEDGRVILWDFSAASLHRPRNLPNQTAQRRISMGSTLSLVRRHGDGSVQNLPLEEDAAGRMGARFHEAPKRGEVAMLQPVMIKLIEPTILTSISFLPDSAVTISRMGSLRFWIRPKEKEKGRVGGGLEGVKNGGR